MRGLEQRKDAVNFPTGPTVPSVKFSYRSFFFVQIMKGFLLFLLLGMDGPFLLLLLRDLVCQVTINKIPEEEGSVHSRKEKRYLFLNSIWTA